MKSRIITLVNQEVSKGFADRCVLSGQSHGIDIDIFSAVDKFNSARLFDEWGLTKNLPMGVKDTPQTDHRGHQHRYLNTAEAGCFGSHYILWQECVRDNKPILILEHDALIINNMPKVLPKNFETIIISRHNYMMDTSGARHDGFDLLKDGYTKHPDIDWMFGTHAYIVSPKGAKKLIQAAQTTRIWPLDMFMSKSVVKRVYYHPYVVALSANAAQSFISSGQPGWVQ